MPDSGDVLHQLEQSRMEKLRELGFVTYNLSVNGEPLPPAQRKIVWQMRDCVGLERKPHLGERQSKQGHLDQEELNEKAIELGVLRFNDAVDRGYGSEQSDILLAELHRINQEILQWKCDAPEEAAEEYPVSEENADASEEMTSWELERIPDNYKACACGYCNRSCARFCGKCGAKLPG